MKTEKSDDNIMKNSKYFLKNENQIIHLRRKLSNSPLTKNINKNKIANLEMEKEKNLNNNNKSKKIKIPPLPRNNSPNCDYKSYFNGKLNPQKQVENKNILVINDLIGEDAKKPIELIFNRNIKNFIQGKNSKKSFGIIKAYSANTNQGIIRNYNEDRVSIVINMNIPNTDKNKKLNKISYFGVFDGHGGNKCAEYLRDNLLKLIIENKNFPTNMNLSIQEAFQKADEEFLKNIATKNGQILDCSGSCALVLLLINNMAYVINVGDSRCLISYSNGEIKKAVTRDHKPNYKYEKERIITNGGIIYQSQNVINFEDNNISLKEKILIGPYRVLPGRLSVSRTFGDAEAKLSEYGGLPNVVISQPDIYTFNIEKDNVDYFILGCDGIFDQLSDNDIFDCVYLVINHNKELLNKKNKNINIHNTCGDIVNLILNASMERKSFDNVTCIFVALKDLCSLKLNDTNINNNSNNNNIIPYNKNRSYKISLNSSKSTKNTINISLDSKNNRKDSERNSSLKTKIRVPSTKSSEKNRITIDCPNRVIKRIIQNSKKYSSSNIVFNPNNLKINKTSKKTFSNNKSNKKNNEISKNNSKKFLIKSNLRNMNNSYSLKYYSFTDNHYKNNLNSENSKTINSNDINNKKRDNTNSKKKNISRTISKTKELRTDRNSVEKNKKKIISVNSIFERDKNNGIIPNKKLYNNKNNKSTKRNKIKINIFNSEINGNCSNKSQKNKFIEYKIGESSKNLFHNYFKYSLNSSKKNYNNNNDVKIASINLNYKNELSKTNFKISRKSSLNNDKYHTQK